MFRCGKSAPAVWHLRCIHRKHKERHFSPVTKTKRGLFKVKKKKKVKKKVKKINLSIKASHIVLGFHSNY